MWEGGLSARSNVLCEDWLVSGWLVVLVVVSLELGGWRLGKKRVRMRPGLFHREFGRFTLLSPLSAPPGLLGQCAGWHLTGGVGVALRVVG